MEGSARALTLETRQWPTRAVEEPEQERIIQGPREGFTEDLLTNLGLEEDVNESKLKKIKG